MIKGAVILDVMCIAAFFVLRLIAGAYVIDVAVSGAEIFIYIGCMNG